MFPGKLMLNVDDIASLTGYTKGHIYNLASAKKLPFKVAASLGDRILVSIVEMANYLDKDLLTETTEQTPSPQIEVKKKVGRPRGTTKARLEVRCFQSELRTAIYKFEGGQILADVRQSVERMYLLDDGSLSCVEKFNLAKTGLMHDVGHADARFADIDIRLSTPSAQAPAESSKLVSGSL
jgi:hypothetical protein